MPSRQECVCGSDLPETERKMDSWGWLFLLLWSVDRSYWAYFSLPQLAFDLTSTLRCVTAADTDRRSHSPLPPGTMPSILFAKYVSFEHSMCSPRPVKICQVCLDKEVLETALNGIFDLTKCRLKHTSWQRVSTSSCFAHIDLELDRG